MEKTESIGIITFHRAVNFGAFLQVYALQEVLKRIFPDREVSVADYVPDEMAHEESEMFSWNYEKQYSPKTNLIRLLEKYYDTFSYRRRRRKFEKCLRLLNLKKIDEPVFFDALVLGSDQIWNPIPTGGIVKYFYGIHPDITYKRIISYAASMGGIRYSNKTEEEQVGNYLSALNAISLREDSDKEYAKKLSHKDITTVLDPTLLLGQRFWNRFAVRMNKKKYILIYSLENSPKMTEAARKEAQKKGLKIIILSPPPLINKAFFNTKYLYDIGPRDFVGLVRNAESVYTNSFHAICFSIIFRKDFYAYLHSRTGNRVFDLLDKLGLSDRVVWDMPAHKSGIVESAYKEVYKKLAFLRREARLFLTENI